MNKKLMIMAFSLVMLSGCAGGNNAAEETVSDTIAAAVETTTETTAEETTAAETESETTTESTAEETTETETEPETTSGSTAEETVKSEETAAAVTADDVHEWENIDYTSEAEVEESGRTSKEETSFADYALSVIGDENIVKYYEENSDHFAEFMKEGTSYSANIACIYGDFDKDGEQEYLAATNYGTGSANNIAIVDNGEVVYWASDISEKEPFYKVRVGEYFKADPEKITGGRIEDYIKYTYCDYTATEDNRFIGVRSNSREAINYYYQINYNGSDGYSIKLLRTAGWNTNAGEDEDGNIIGRQFVEENF